MPVLESLSESAGLGTGHTSSLLLGSVTEHNAESSDGINEQKDVSWALGSWGGGNDDGEHVHTHTRMPLRESLSESAGLGTGHASLLLLLVQRMSKLLSR